MFPHGAADRKSQRQPAAATDLTRQVTLDPPRFMNLVGLLGWTFNGRILRRKHLSPVQLALFETLMPLFTLEDRFVLPIGLGVYAAAEKPAA